MTKMATSNNKSGYILASKIKRDDGTYKDMFYCGLNPYTNDHWGEDVRNSNVFESEEEIYTLYEELLACDAPVQLMNPNIFDRMYIEYIDIKFSPVDVDTDRLKRARQRRAVRKLSKQEIYDLGLDEIATMFRLEHNDEDGEFHTRSKVQYSIDLISSEIDENIPF